jgi:hypothetical protein
MRFEGDVGPLATTSIVLFAFVIAARSLGTYVYQTPLMLPGRA